jgi:hypothetical protein
LLDNAKSLDQVIGPSRLADIVAIKQGHVYFLEVKSDTGRNRNSGRWARSIQDADGALRGILHMRWSENLLGGSMGVPQRRGLPHLPFMKSHNRLI